MNRSILLAAAMLTGAFAAGCSTTQSQLTPQVKPIVIAAPALVINPSQPGVDQIVIERADFTKPGFVVIRADNNGAPGDIISHSEMLSTGRHENFGININPVKAGARVIAVMHSDDGNVLFEFPGPDGPTLVNGQPITSIVNLK